LKHLINENILVNGMIPFDEQAAAKAAEAQMFEDTEWVLSGTITVPKTTVRDRASFVAGARYQHAEMQEEILKLKVELAELKKFQSDAIRMAADFYMNPLKKI
jgi:hypothetical protein